MAIDPRKEEIFKAWYDYDHATGDEEKGTAKYRRNNLIDAFLTSVEVHCGVSEFLSCFREDYVEWLCGSGLVKGGKRRF